MRLQRTLKKQVLFRGIGLHTGKHTTVKLKPAPRDTGIVFYRTDKGALIRASIASVGETAFATTIGLNGVRIKTVEHLLAAASGLGIDNMVIEVDGPEVPILDGSSTHLVEMILEAGIAKQGKERPVLKITRPLMYKDAHARITALPYEGMRISYYIQFNHQLLGEQEYSLELTEENFIREIAPARTFGFLQDVETLRANGLAKGGSFDNAVIIGEQGVLNATGLRFHDEFVRHKILDAIGDLSLIGFPIEGHVILEKAGHTANINFLRKLHSAIDCYEVISQSSSLNQHALSCG
ncbi:MAG: UDP-3-O-acyl-N-acetylglucosamine deacetylase [Dissulfurispiraceae bacterium]